MTCVGEGEQTGGRDGGSRSGMVRGGGGEGGGGGTGESVSYDVEGWKRACILFLFSDLVLVENALKCDFPCVL